MSTIVFHQGALGDLVLTWPLLRSMGDVSLVSHWGKAKLTERWLANTRAMDGDSPEFARLFVPAGQCEVGDALLKALRTADRVVSFISNANDAWAHNLLAIRGRKGCYFVPHRPPDNYDEHATIFHGCQLASQGLGVSSLHPPSRRNPDGPAVIHPGSGGRAKCWPADRFDALVTHFQAMGRSVQVVLGEAERQHMDPRWPARWRRSCEVIEPADYIDLSLVLSRASLYIGNDSGPTHLAAQVGVPTLALFGPSNPHVWMPQGPAVGLMAPPHPQAMDWLSVQRVINAAAVMG